MDIKCRLAPFPKFAALPTEVRLLIWQHALPAPRIIYISENSMDDPEELGIDNALLSGVLVPSRLYSAQDFALERSCVEARELVASRYKPIACAPTDPQQRIWNGFAWTDDYGFKMVEMESPIAWPENIRVDLSRDILYLGVTYTTYFQDIFKIPGLDWPRILNETRRLAITGETFIKLRPAKEKDSTRGNSMVYPEDREYEIFDDVEANTIQATELLERFKNVREVILSLCGECYFTSAVDAQIDPGQKAQWEDWGLAPCSLSSLPTSGPSIDPGREYVCSNLMYESSNNITIKRQIQLCAFRLRGIIQALEEEKKRGRLKQVEKFRVAQVVTMVTARESFTPGWHLHCGPTGRYFNRDSRAEDQDINFL